MLKELTKQNKDNKEQENKTNETTIVPYVDIYETNNEFVVKAEIPGVTKDSVEVTLEDGELLVQAVANKEQQEQTYKEYELTKYYRSFKVANVIESEKIKADLKNGVLTLTLPKNEKLKPRKIQIVSEN
jgi:HSP20 family protein